MQQPLLEPKSGVLTRLELVPGLQEAMALLIGLPLHAISIYPLEVSLQFLVYQLFSLTVITISYALAIAFIFPFSVLGPVCVPHSEQSFINRWDRLCRLLLLPFLLLLNDPRHQPRIPRLREIAA